MSYQDFPEMPVWQTAADLVKDVYLLANLLPRTEDYALSSQLKRASLNISSNIAEAFGRSHTKEKRQFYLYARGSAFETRSHLLIGTRLSFFSEEQICEPNSRCLNIIESLNKLMKSLRTQP